MLNAAAVARAASRAGIEPFSFVLRSLNGRPVKVEVEAWLPLYPASMIKTPLAAAVLALVSDGTVELESRWPIEAQNMTANDTASPLVPGYEARLEELVHLAIARSDNVATNVLFDIVGRERATVIAQERFGLRSTAFHRKLSGGDPLIYDPGWDGVHRNTHPAGDAAALFASIAFGRVPLAGLLRRALSAQIWNDKLASGLSPGDTFAHKTGDTSEITHDGGILVTQAGASFVLVLYSAMESSERNNARFATFMREIRPMVNGVLESE